VIEWLPEKSKRGECIGEVVLPVSELPVLRQAPSRDGAGAAKLNQSRVSIGKGGTIMFMAAFHTYSPDRVRVLVNTPSEPYLPYDLLRLVPLKTHVQLLSCIHGVTDDPELQTLQFVDGDSYLSQKQLADLRFQIEENTEFRLVPTPVSQVKSIVAGLKEKEQTQKKKSLFELKALLEIKEFARVFVEADGVQVLASNLLDPQETGNSIAYVFAALGAVLGWGVGFNNATQDLIQVIVDTLRNTDNLQIRLEAVRVATQLADSRTVGRPRIETAILQGEGGIDGFFQKMFSTFFGTLIL
jgi:hypothetical protein